MDILQFFQRTQHVQYKRVALISTGAPPSAASLAAPTWTACPPRPARVSAPPPSPTTAARGPPRPPRGSWPSSSSTATSTWAPWPRWPCRGPRHSRRRMTILLLSLPGGGENVARNVILGRRVEKCVERCILIDDVVGDVYLHINRVQQK